MQHIGWDDAEWQHIDPWMAQYWRVDRFQEVTLANSDEHLTRAQLIFPQSASLAPVSLLTTDCGSVSLCEVNIVHTYEVIAEWTKVKAEKIAVLWVLKRVHGENEEERDFNNIRLFHNNNTSTMALFFWSAPAISHQSVTVNQHAWYQDPQTKSSKPNSFTVDLHDMSNCPWHLCLW